MNCARWTGRRVDGSPRWISRRAPRGSPDGTRGSSAPSTGSTDGSRPPERRDAHRYLRIDGAIGPIDVDLAGAVRRDDRERDRLPVGRPDPMAERVLVEVGEHLVREDVGEPDGAL